MKEINKDIYFLRAERFSSWEKQGRRKKRILTPENIRQICDRSNWKLGIYEKIKGFGYSLNTGFFDGISFKMNQKKTEGELKQEIQSLAKEVRRIWEEINHSEFMKLLQNLEKDGEF